MRGRGLSIRRLVPRLPFSIRIKLRFRNKLLYPTCNVRVPGARLTLTQAGLPPASQSDLASPNLHRMVRRFSWRSTDTLTSRLTLLTTNAIKYAIQVKVVISAQLVADTFDFSSRVRYHRTSPEVVRGCISLPVHIPNHDKANPSLPGRPEVLFAGTETGSRANRC